MLAVIASLLLASVAVSTGEPVNYINKSQICTGQQCSVDNPSDFRDIPLGKDID